MTQVHASAERLIAAPADLVYTILSDHQHHHTHILPENFSNVRVEKGGIGAGTVVSYRLKAGGRTNDYRAVIGEPQPGRVMTESIEGTNMVTTFTVTPEANGSRVRIETNYDKGGIQGLFERILAPRLLVPIYRDELERLDHYAQGQKTAS